jgi:hypothetical protein
MAFTDAHKDSTRGHLNYPVESWTITFIGDRMDSLSSLSPEAETRVIAMLATLDAIDTQRNDYLAESAGLETAERITGYYRGQALSEIDSQYKYWQKKLSIALSISIWESKTSPALRRG